MEDIFSEYGTALLGMIAGCGMLAILWELIYGGGVMGSVLVQFMQGLCG